MVTAMVLRPEQPIGIFDSGVGGLTVVRAVQQALPNERLVYLGDTARVPYGNRNVPTIVRFTREAARFLIQQEVKMVLVACNTASAAALPVLQAELPVPVLGAVEPGVQSAVAATRNGIIGVIATRATVRSEAYAHAIQAWNPRARVISLACPLFVPLIEEGWFLASDSIVLQVVERYLRELHVQAPQLDTLVLACTHYPLLYDAIDQVVRQLWPHPVRLVDSAEAMAHMTKERLTALGALHAPSPSSDSAFPKFYVTDEARVAEIGRHFLGSILPNLTVVDL